MKKVYITPAMEITATTATTNILAGSGNLGGEGNDDPAIKEDETWNIWEEE